MTDGHERESITQVKLGDSPIKGFPAIYGTRVRCRCGWKAQFNGKKPADGGRVWAVEKHTAHQQDSIYRTAR